MVEPQDEQESEIVHNDDGHMVLTHVFLTYDYLTKKNYTFEEWQTVIADPTIEDIDLVWLDEGRTKNPQTLNKSLVRPKRKTRRKRIPTSQSISSSLTGRSSFVSPPTTGKRTTTKRNSGSIVDGGSNSRITKKRNNGPSLSTPKGTAGGVTPRSETIIAVGDTSNTRLASSSNDANLRIPFFTPDNAHTGRNNNNTKKKHRIRATLPLRVPSPQRGSVALIPPKSAQQQRNRNIISTPVNAVGIQSVRRSSRRDRRQPNRFRDGVDTAAMYEGDDGENEECVNDIRELDDDDDYNMPRLSSRSRDDDDDDSDDDNTASETTPTNRRQTTRTASIPASGTVRTNRRRTIRDHDDADDDDGDNNDDEYTHTSTDGDDTDLDDPDFDVNGTNKKRKRGGAGKKKKGKSVRRSSRSNRRQPYRFRGGVDTSAMDEGDDDEDNERNTTTVHDDTASVQASNRGTVPTNPHGTANTTSGTTPTNNGNDDDNEAPRRSSRLQRLTNYNNNVEFDVNDTIDGGDTDHNDHANDDAGTTTPTTTCIDWTAELRDTFPAVDKKLHKQKKDSNKFLSVLLADASGVKFIYDMKMDEDYWTKFHKMYSIVDMPCEKNISGEITILKRKKRKKGEKAPISRMRYGVHRTKEGYYCPHIYVRRKVKLSENKQIIVDFACGVDWHVMDRFQEMHEKSIDERNDWETTWYNHVIIDGNVKDNCELGNSHLDSIKDNIARSNNIIEPNSINSSRFEYCCRTGKCIGDGCDVSFINRRCNHDPPCDRVYLFLCNKCDDHDEDDIISDDDDDDDDDDNNSSSSTVHDDDDDDDSDTSCSSAAYDEDGWAIKKKGRKRKKCSIRDCTTKVRYIFGNRDMCLKHLRKYRGTTFT